MRGTKYDDGKPMVDLIFEDFPKALMEIAKVATFGAEKYAPGNWRKVEDGENRYRHAAGRHMLDRCAGRELDDESGLYHEAHEIWSRLAAFELKLTQRKPSCYVVQRICDGQYLAHSNTRECEWTRDIAEAVVYINPDLTKVRIGCRWVEL
jgi:hypothetical protein